MRQPPHVFTFYSYKGGVGRSMALLNVAYQLVGWGRHVLLLDFDLEAPGLSGFLNREEVYQRGKGSASGTKDGLDLLNEIAASPPPALTGDAEGDVRAMQAWSRERSPLQDFVHSVDKSQWKERAPHLLPKVGVPGRFDVIPLDEGRDYCQRLATLDFPHRSVEELQDLGSALRFYLRNQRFESRWPEDLGEVPEVPYDYVLVDSRTGLTEIGGLCLGSLADRLIVLTGLNDQNIHGTALALEEIGISSQAGESWDADDEPGEDRPPQLGPKPTLIVASPVPAGEMDMKRQRFDEVGAKLGPVGAKLSYHPQMALFETAFVRDFPDEYLGMEYRSLALRIQEMVSDDPGSVGGRMRSLSQDDRETALEETVRLVLLVAMSQPESAANFLIGIANELPRVHGVLSVLTVQRFYSSLWKVASGENRNAVLNNWGTALSAQAKTKQGAQADALFEQAGSKYAQALEIKPDDREALYNWGNALSAQAKTKQGAQADALFEQAGSKYAQALEIKPDKHEALNNWGTALSDQAKTKQGAQADALFEQAGSKYAQALEIKPDDHEALNNWGTALSAQAKTKQGAQADALFEQAGSKYAQALEIKPDDHEALNNWGTALSAQAKTKQGAQADALFEQAGSKYAQALEIKPDDHEALNNWGTALSAQAKTKQGAQADALFEQAGSKYAQALEIKPDDHEALNNWGTALSAQAKTKQGAQADALFEQAGSKYAQALEIKPDKHEALINWGNALSAQAKTKQGAQADALFEQAGSKYALALEIKPDNATAHYNLGCLDALQGEVEAAIRHLRAAVQSGGDVDKRKVAEDSDFDRIREAPAFVEFVDSLAD